ncbi:ATP-binding protein [Rummeliibacillus sp. TYF-LIM-RU47]|uniref:hybrid sensor histidine kinase/response regulator n=1 Tax=unclassified Rummeliibacillus TaxID=2622809 RepID=UPI001239B740|nr:ATP-binding protein [Rummeliibacillus sp. TYF-LIM-RU47]
MKRIIFIVLSIIVFITTLVGINHSFHTSNKTPFPVDNGVLSLTNWNTKSDPIIMLNGNWEFYPNELIEPRANRDVFKRHQQIQKQIAVPGDWKKAFSNKTSNGFGTYRLTIKVPTDGSYGIQANSIRNSSKIYINGVEAGGAGQPAEQKENFIYSNQNYTVFGKSRNKQLEIVVQAANYTYHTGGIVHPLTFGRSKDVTAKQELSELIEVGIITGFILIGLIHFFTFLQRRRYVDELYFALFCIVLGIYNSMLNSYVFFTVFPSFTAHEQSRLQLSAIHLVVLFFLLFVSRLFIEHTKRKVSIFLSILLCVQLIIVNTYNPLSFIIPSISLYVRQIMLVAILAICFIYILQVLLKAFLGKKEGSEYLLLTMTTFMCYGLVLGLNFLFEIEAKSMLPLLGLLMIFSLSLLLSYRYQTAYKRIQNLSEELLVQHRLKDEFLVRTSSELSTPIDTILNKSLALMEGIDGPLKRSQHEKAIAIYNEGKRVASLVEDLLFVSNSKNKDILTNPRAVDLKVAEEVIAEIQYMYAQKMNVKLINHIRHDLPLIFIDEQKLKQVLTILLSNAIHATNQGTITIDAKVVQEEMEISVTDSGIGIANEHIELIFTPFYQIDNHTNDQEGLGIGLSIAKNTIELAGGKIRVISEVGKGSCFTFTVPLLSNAVLDIQTEQLDPARGEQLYAATLLSENSDNYLYTILVVDGELGQRRIIQQMVQALQYKILSANNGEEALNIIKRESIDLIITDTLLMDMSGYELCQSVREEYGPIELPVILLQSAKHTSNLVLSFQVGANGYLQKPIQKEELKARIESLLRMKKSAQDALHDELSFHYAQIKPHFLYNSLNTIIGLSYTDEEKTREALQHLAVYFRAKLDYRRPEALVSLEDEIELVESYLAIEKMRFGSRLNVIFDIDETIDQTIPSMTIQPLVENAVQHGISKNKNGGTLLLSIQEEAGYIHITIQDDGVGMPLEKQRELLEGRSNRLGFTNPLKKLKLIKGTVFQLESKKGKGTKVTIQLPR